jgi:PiT family inorganic phosphate transporter
MLLRRIKRSSRSHMIRYESWVRTGLIVVGAFGAYSLGANNIANVMGVFVSSISLPVLDLGILELSSGQQLFLLGGMAIAAGIITYSERVMKTVGNSLMELNADAALIVVLSHSLVLFIFSSTTLSDFIAGIGLPRIPLVPVSSSQVIVGAIIGIGLYKGVRNINTKTLGGIVSGWVTTPIIAGVISFVSLFFVQNVFNIEVVKDVIGTPDSPTQGGEISYTPDTNMMVIVILGIVAITFAGMWYNEKNKQNRKI